MCKRIHNIEECRKDFPILKTFVGEKRDIPLIYLDNAATSQMPMTVIDRIAQFYEEEKSNIHRGMYYLSERAEIEYDNARTKVKCFINAASDKEIIFTAGTTESINLIKNTFALQHLDKGDNIIVTIMEHHSNSVPWIILGKDKGINIKVVPINDLGELVVSEYIKLFDERTKLVCVAHASNVLGTINPVKELVSIAHKRNTPVLVDGAQSIPHLKVDVRDLDCDFYAFSSHKMFGPNSVGVLYARQQFLEEAPPYQLGGGMIDSVSFENVTYQDLPRKYEAGTPKIAEAIGLGAAIDYLCEYDWKTVQDYEMDLLNYATESLVKIDSLRIIGNAKSKVPVISFVVDGVGSHDIANFLDKMVGIAIRAGDHCAQPLMKRFELASTARISIALYNSKDEIDVFVRTLKEIIAMVRRAA